MSLSPVGLRLRSGGATRGCDKNLCHIKRLSCFKNARGGKALSTVASFAVSLRCSFPTCFLVLQNKRQHERNRPPQVSTRLVRKARFVNSCIATVFQNDSGKQQFRQTLRPDRTGGDSRPSLQTREALPQAGEQASGSRQRMREAPPRGGERVRGPSVAGAGGAAAQR